MAKPKEDRLGIGGMYAAGDPEMIPDGATRLQENMVFRPGRVEKRPPFILEAAAVPSHIGTLRGLANWSDSANRIERLVLFLLTTASGTMDLKVKATSGEAWSAAITGVTEDGYVSDFANYRNLLYYTVTSGVAANAVPAGLHSFNGSVVTQYPIGGETLFSLTVTPYGDRLQLGNVRASVLNRLGTTNAYDSTAWSQVTTTQANITNGSTVTSRITPTATTNSKIYLADQYTAAATTSDTTLIYRSDLRSTSPTYEMPLTLEIYYSQIWVTVTAYALGAIRVPTTAGGNGFRYRVTVAGTSAVGEPAWPTTVGTTVVDGTVTWICDGKDAIGSLPTTLPTLTDESDFLPYFVRAVIPPNPAATKVGVRIKFGTAASGTIELAPIDISLKDGLTDGDLNKKNFGQQLTVGKFVYPFFNQQSSATATISLDNDIYFTETSDPNSILGSSFYRLSDLPGRMTAAANVGGRYVAFKRRGMWVFQLGSDPKNPLIRERFFANVGCVGPRALCVFEDALYFVSENEVYRWKPGGVPEPLCGDAMREEVTGRTSSYTANVWLEDVTGEDLLSVIAATVDEKNRDLLLGTQARYVHCYDLDSGAWSRFSGIAASMAAPPYLTYPLWNPNTRHVYLADSGSRVSRYDDSATAEALFNGVSIVAGITTFRALPRDETVLDGIWLHYIAPATQAASTFTAFVSLDGINYNLFNTIRLSTTGLTNKTKGRVWIPLRQSGSGLVIQIQHVGAAGGASFTMTAVDVVTRTLRRGERNRTNATPLAATL